MLFALKRFIAFALLWLILTAADPGGLATGLLAVAAATAASLVLLPPAGAAVRLLPLIAMVPGFLARSVAGGIDVAWRALHPRLPLDTGWVVYRMRLPPGAARASLGSEFSLLPGTLVAGSAADRLYVHCLDRGQDPRPQLGREEARIAAIIGFTLPAARRDGEDGGG